MNHLTVTTFPTHKKNEFNVYWGKKINESHLIKVTINKIIAGADPAVVAELETTRYLLEKKEIFGKGFSGPGLFLYVSQPKTLSAIIDINDLNHRYGRFMSFKYRNCQIKQVKDIITHETLIVSKESISIDTLPQRPAIKTKTLGKVIITEHAMNRFAQGYPQSKNPWKTLIKDINKDLIKQELPSIIAKQKEIKYFNQEGGMGEIWRNPFNQRHFVTSLPNLTSSRHLITVYTR